MKTKNAILALALALAVLVTGEARAGGMKYEAFGSQTGITAGQMRWLKVLTTDSTSVAIAVWGGAVTVAAASETTAWLDTGSEVFPDVAAKDVPLVLFEVEHQVGAAIDSVGYIVQWTNNPNTNALAVGSTFVSSAMATPPTSGLGATATLVTAIDSDQAPGGGRWCRLIVVNAKVGSGATRRYSVRPFRLKNVGL